MEGDADDSDFWDKVVVTDSIELVVLAMPHHAGNLNALAELQRNGFTGTVAAVVLHADQIDTLYEHGAHAVFHIYAEAGEALADDAASAADLT